MSVQVVYERARGCGFRKSGALYFRTDGRGWECGALPIELSVCPCCGAGIKPTRGFTWINLAEIAGKSSGCRKDDGCGSCPLADAKIQRAGLLWIGEQYYATPSDWLRETDAMGISRRIATIPYGFVIGETWVALAHRKAIISLEFGRELESKPAIFHVFRPQRVEYVCTGKETEEEIAGLEKRGITPVIVKRAETELLGVAR